MSCRRAEGSLGDTAIKTVQDAKKEPLGPKDLANLFKGKTRLMVAKGKKLHDLKFKDVGKAELEKLVIGPSGKLRAPTLIRGSKVMVGYHEEGYDEFLG